MNKVLMIALVTAGSCLAQTNVVRVSPLLKATPEYRRAVLANMLREANVYARRLHLPEKLPLTSESLREKFIASPHLATDFGALGSFHTTNYSYGFGKGRHLTYIMRLPKDKSGRSLYERFKPWKIDPTAVNTNAAYMMATQFLGQAFVDLSQLSSATVSVNPITVRDMTTCVYTVEWQRGGIPTVDVSFGQRKGELWTLRVEDPDIILRKPLQVPNVESLLSQTNAPPVK